MPSRVGNLPREATQPSCPPNMLLWARKQQKNDKLLGPDVAINRAWLFVAFCSLVQGIAIHPAKLFCNVHTSVSGVITAAARDVTCSPRFPGADLTIHRAWLLTAHSHFEVGSAKLSSVKIGVCHMTMTRIHPGSTSCGTSGPITPNRDGTINWTGLHITDLISS